MKTAEERIRDLVRNHTIDDADAERLLDAVRPPRPSPINALANPFERWSGEVTSLAGVFVSLLGLAASRMGARFDGAFDMHVGHANVSWLTALTDQLVAYPVTAVVFWAVARIAAPRTRFVDMLGVIGVSRLATTLLAFPALLLMPYVPSGAGKLNAALIVTLVLALAGIGTHFYWLVQGFRTTSGLRGGRMTAFVLLAICVAEVVSKLLVRG